MPEGEAHPNPEPLSGATNSPPKSLLEIADADAASRPANRTPASTRRPGSSKPSPRSNLHRPGGAVSTERRSKENTPGAVTNQRKRRKVQEDSDTSHMGDSDQEGEGDEKGARGARVRQVKRSKPAPAARELRTRVPKTAEQIRQEKERERAYRRATAR